MATFMRRAVEGAGLAPVAYRLRERYIAARAWRSPRFGRDGLPLPPPVLRVRVTGHADADRFQEFGALGAETVRQTLLEQFGEPSGAVLEWGCGCGRVLRHLVSERELDLAGSDLSGDAVTWVRNALGVDARMNTLEPYLPFADGRFRMVYAFSVFTHLTPDLSERWFQEVMRVLEPGGVFLFSVKGRKHAQEELSVQELGRFESGSCVVTVAGAEGMNACACYMPREWVVAELARGAELLAFTEAGAVTTNGQDLVLVRKKGGGGPGVTAQ